MALGDGSAITNFPLPYPSLATNWEESFEILTYFARQPDAGLLTTQIGANLLYVTILNLPDEIITATIATLPPNPSTNAPYTLSQLRALGNYPINSFLVWPDLPPPPDDLQEAEYHERESQSAYITRLRFQLYSVTNALSVILRFICPSEIRSAFFHEFTDIPKKSFSSIFADLRNIYGPYPPSTTSLQAGLTTVLPAPTHRGLQEALIILDKAYKTLCESGISFNEDDKVEHLRANFRKYRLTNILLNTYDYNSSITTYSTLKTWFLKELPHVSVEEEARIRASLPSSPQE